MQLYLLVMFLQCFLCLCCAYLTNAQDHGEPSNKWVSTSSSRRSRDDMPNMELILAGIFQQNPQISQPCKDGWEYLLTHTQPLVSKLPEYGNATLFAYAVDSFGRPGPGLQDGNLFAYGSYDECLMTSHTQYCLVPIYYPQKIFKPKLKFAVCIPQECDETDAAITSLIALSLLQQTGQVVQSPFVNKIAGPVTCEKEIDPPLNAGAIVMIAVCCLLVLAATIGTTVDWLSHTVEIRLVQSNKDSDKDKSTETEDTSVLKSKANQRNKSDSIVFQVITAFSLFKTIPTILSTKQPPSAITSLNGIRVISMFWIIMFHTHMRLVIDNELYVYTDIGRSLSYQVVARGYIAVDTFFFLSGLLVSYHTLREMARTEGRFPLVRHYLHRYLRITPTYAFLLFVNWFLTMHLFGGPGYQDQFGVNSARYEACEKYWWTNMLYISNIYPTELGDECMRWSWYLANDMQFFFVSPLMIVLLYYSLPLGLLSVGIFLIGCFAANGAIMNYYDMDASYPGTNLLSMIMIMPNIDSLMNSSQVYIKPYTRITPFLVGIVVGYLFYREAKISFTNATNWLIYLGMWSLAALFCLIPVYGLYNTWHGHPLNETENTLFSMFSPFIWSLGLALVVFACHNGYGWVVNSFLSMKLWIPLGKLTFNAYLLHLIILTPLIASLRQPTIHYTGIKATEYVVATAALSYGTAAIVATFVEFPLAHVEAILFKQLGLSGRDSVKKTN